MLSCRRLKSSIKCMTSLTSYKQLSHRLNCSITLTILSSSTATIATPRWPHRVHMRAPSGATVEVTTARERVRTCSRMVVLRDYGAIYISSFACLFYLRCICGAFHVNIDI